VNDRLSNEVLSRIALFRGLSDAELAEVLDAAQVRPIAPGESLFEQDADATAFFVLLTGRVKVAQLTPEGQQVVVRFVGPGEMLGCVALVSGSTYPGTAEVSQAGRVLVWDGPTTEQLMKRAPRLALNALAIQGRHLREMQNRCRELATERVERRVARAVLRLAGQAGRQLADGLHIGFPISRQDLAEITGTTLYTVSRTLTGWERRGLVALGREEVVICDAVALQAIAEDLEVTLAAT